MRWPTLALVVLLCACSRHASSANGKATANGDPGLLVEAAPAQTGKNTGRSAAPAGAKASTSPITTPVGHWSWLPIEGSFCANGTPTGIGVNRSSTSQDLLIMLEGGGACWDATTCLLTRTAVHLDETYDEKLFVADFAAHAVTTGDPANPLSAANAIFIPYCTGDLHAGDVVRTYELAGASRALHHVGARNVDAALARVRAGLPAPKTVWVLGSSAGGYGATLNFEQIAAAFPQATVHLLADCSPLLTPKDGRWEVWKRAWDMRMPQGCPDCATRFGAVVDRLAVTQPRSRIGLLAYSEDATIAVYFGFDGAAYARELDALLQSSYQHPNTRYFVAQGTSHVMLGNVDGVKAGDGTALSAFLAGFTNGLDSFRNTR